MLTLKDISKRYELSGKQTKNLRAAVGPVIEPYLTRGEHNTVLIHETAIAIFDRAMELKRSGLSWSAIGNQLVQDIGTTPNKSQGSEGANTGSTTAQHTGQPRTDRADSRINTDPNKVGLQGQLDVNDLFNFLKSQLEVKDDEILALRDRVHNLETLALPLESEGRQRLTRLQALRIALLGR